MLCILWCGFRFGFISIDFLFWRFFNLDLLLIMTVHPGFGGQSFQPEMMEKMRRAQDLRNSLGMRYKIEVDGGITPETARLSIENGADVIVAGTAIFKTDDYAAAIRDLRGPGSA